MPWAASTSACRSRWTTPYSGLHLSKGRHHVSGITALEYARDRHSFATSDLARIQDQQRLLSSMLSEAISSGTLGNPVKLDRFLRAALAAIKVDQGLNVAALADQMRGISPGDVRFMTVPISDYNYQAPTGQLALLWDAKESQALFSELKNDQRPAKPAPGRPAGQPSCTAARCRSSVERHADRRPVRYHRRRPDPAGLPGQGRADLAGARHQPDPDRVPARGRRRGQAGPEGDPGRLTEAGQGAGQGAGHPGHDRLLGDLRDGHAEPGRLLHGVPSATAAQDACR